MRLLYTLGIFGLGLYMSAAALFNRKAKQWVEGRRFFFKRNEPLTHPNVCWFHCASLGEFDMAIPVMNSLKSKDPSVFILVSFFSPSGMNFYHKRTHPANRVVYLPLDTPSNARKFIAHFKPRNAFFVKYEFWSNFLFESKKAGVKTFSICSSFRDNQLYFKWYGGFFRRTLKQLDWFYVQNKKSNELLRQLGLNNSLIVGDTRFDRVIEHKKGLQPNPRIEAFLNGKKATVIGSSWRKDEELWWNYLKLHPTQKFILAPHEIDAGHIEFILDKLQGHAQLYTASNDASKHVLILNTIGHLSVAYAYGCYAYVGGGFSGRLHNILEPAVFGLPVIFGPKHQRFPEANQFIEKGFGFSVASSLVLEETIRFVHENMGQLNEKSSRFVEQNTGASQRIVNHWLSFFHS
jgi:3-deoxy-D-manno-octulosonic-acid transferase